MASAKQYRTEQDRIDSLTMAITNPNVVGSGYIQFPPQRPFEKPVVFQPPTVAHLEFPTEYQDYIKATGQQVPPAVSPTAVPAARPPAPAARPVAPQTAYSAPQPANNAPPPAYNAPPPAYNAGARPQAPVQQLQQYRPAPAHYSQPPIRPQAPQAQPPQRPPQAQPHGRPGATPAQYAPRPAAPPQQQAPYAVRPAAPPAATHRPAPAPGPAPVAQRPSSAAPPSAPQRSVPAAAPHYPAKPSVAQAAPPAAVKAPAAPVPPPSVPQAQALAQKMAAVKVVESSDDEDSMDMSKGGLSKSQKKRLRKKIRDGATK